MNRFIPLSSINDLQPNLELSHMQGCHGARMATVATNVHWAARGSSCKGSSPTMGLLNSVVAFEPAQNQGVLCSSMQLDMGLRIQCIWAPLVPLPLPHPPPQSHSPLRCLMVHVPGSGLGPLAAILQMNTHTPYLKISFIEYTGTYFWVNTYRFAR